MGSFLARVGVIADSRALTVHLQYSRIQRQSQLNLRMSLQTSHKLFSPRGQARRFRNFLPKGGCSAYGSVTFFLEVAQGLMVLQPFTERWSKALWFHNLFPKGGGRAADSLFHWRGAKKIARPKPG